VAGRRAAPPIVRIDSANGCTMFADEPNQAVGPRAVSRLVDPIASVGVGTAAPSVYEKHIYCQTGAKMG
jgi:hypothetical protein